MSFHRLNWLKGNHPIVIEWLAQGLSPLQGLVNSDSDWFETDTEQHIIALGFVWDLFNKNKNELVSGTYSNEVLPAFSEYLANQPEERGFWRCLGINRIESVYCKGRFVSFSSRKQDQIRILDTATLEYSIDCCLGEPKELCDYRSNLIDEDKAKDFVERYFQSLIDKGRLKGKSFRGGQAFFWATLKREVSELSLPNEFRQALGLDHFSDGVRLSKVDFPSSEYVLARKPTWFDSGPVWYYLSSSLSRRLGLTRKLPRLEEGVSELVHESMDWPFSSTIQYVGKTENLAKCTEHDRILFTKKIWEMLVDSGHSHQIIEEIMQLEAD